jgi:hypothetical protein
LSVATLEQAAQVTMAELEHEQAASVAEAWQAARNAGAPAAARALDDVMALSVPMLAAQRAWLLEDA